MAFCYSLVSQPSKCLKFMTFREGCVNFVAHVERKYLSEALEILSPSVLQKMK